MTQSEGTKFRILCSTEKGSSPLFFQWTKDGNVISSNSEVNYKIETNSDETSLTIPRIERKDAGNYSCIVRNSVGTDFQSVTLSVKGIIKTFFAGKINTFNSNSVAPKWVLEPNDIRVHAGTDALLECKADGVPKPKIKWITSKGLVFK